MKNQNVACDLAHQAIQLAFDQIDELDEENFHSAKRLIEQLNNNLTQWK